MHLPQKCADASLAFGGIDIIFCGDFIQFTPVLDTPLYCGWESEVKLKKRKRSNRNNLLKAMHLWNQLNHIVFLDEQMRVQDHEYLAMLNRLREGKCTNADVAMLNRRILGTTVSITSIKDAPIITHRNETVMAINDLFCDTHSQHTNVYISTAHDRLSKKKGEKVPTRISKRYKKLANTKTGGLPRELRLFVGMPISVTVNVQTELGITNGTRGVIKSIHFKNGEVIDGESGIHSLKEHPEYIIVELDDINVTQLEGLPPNCIPIITNKSKPKSVKVNMPGKQSNETVYRVHFPLVPRFACTAHKSQGQTLKKAIVDLVSKTEVTGIEFAYVPLSRVRKLEDLTILRPFDPSVLKAEVNEACAAMMEEFKARDLCKDM